MGTFRLGLILAAGILLSAANFGQDAAPGTPENPLPFPLPDTNAPAVPALPQTDPSLSVPLPETIVTNPPPAAAPKPAKKPAAPKIPSVKGTVAKLDTVAMTLTIDVKGKEQVYKINSKTRTFAGLKPAILSDGHPGDNVTVEYRALKDKSREALIIRFPKKDVKETKPAESKPAETPATGPAAVTPLPETPAPAPK